MVRHECVPVSMGPTSARPAVVALPLGALQRLGRTERTLSTIAHGGCAVLARPVPGMTRDGAKARLGRDLEPDCRIPDCIHPRATPDPGSGAECREVRLTFFPAARDGRSLNRRFRRPLLVLMAVAGLLLLIGLGPISPICCSRAPRPGNGKSPVRLAMRASRAPLKGELLTEALLLSEPRSSRGCRSGVGG